MRTTAAVVHRSSTAIELEELSLEGPRTGEVLVRWAYAGLCHSDVHLAAGDLPARLPMVLGHEGAGVVAEVGPGVDDLAVGDHVVGAFIPSCGTCRWCLAGRPSLCDAGAAILEGSLDGHFPFTGRAGSYGAMCMLGAFSEHATVSRRSLVRVDPEVPLPLAALVGCCVPTGWGSAVNSAAVGTGDTVVVLGVGGIGVNAVQGARWAGAASVIAVDPVGLKRDTALRLGATHAVATAVEAADLARHLTHGNGADATIVTPGLLTEQDVTDAVAATGKGGTIVLTGLSRPQDCTVRIPGAALTLWKKTLTGSVFGDCDPATDIPRLLALYRAGELRLDELVTRTYPLEDVERARHDLLEGTVVRAVLSLHPGDATP